MDVLAAVTMTFRLTMMDKASEGVVLEGIVQSLAQRILVIELLGDVTGVDPRGLRGAVVVVVVAVAVLQVSQALSRVWSKRGGTALFPVAVRMSRRIVSGSRVCGERAEGDIEREMVRNRGWLRRRNLGQDGAVLQQPPTAP